MCIKNTSAGKKDSRKVIFADSFVSSMLGFTPVRIEKVKDRQLETVLEHIVRIYPLPESSLSKLTTYFHKESYPKGHVLFQAGTVESKVCFLEKGLARAYCYKGDKQVTFWFGSEGDTIFSYPSYVANKPGYETIELLEDAELYTIELEIVQRLFREDIELANWGRKLAELELIKTEERLISLQFQTGIERYRDFLERSPKLMQRVQLGHIASYLGISQVTLSRIRAEIK